MTELNAAGTTRSITITLNAEEGGVAGELPEDLTIKGFAMNTAHAGNGWHFNHDEVAALAGQTAHFVRDHDTSITAVAGTVKFTEGERFDTEVKHRFQNEDGSIREEVRKESASKPGFEATLSKDFPAYEDVARSIMSQQKAGKVPNVSVFIYASDWSYEESSDRFFMEGPYWVRHLGQVDVGAFSDAVGVGVYEAEFAQGGSPHAGPTVLATLGYDGPAGMAANVPVTCSVRVANMEELTHKFCLENADRPDLIQKLGTRLGLDGDAGERPNTDHILSKHEGCLQSTGESPMETDIEPNTTEATKASTKGPSVEQGAKQATDNPAPAPAPVAKAEVDEAALNERIDARARELFEKELTRRDIEREAKALADRRTSIANSHPGVDVAVLEGMNSIAALDAYEQSLTAARGASLGRDGHTTKNSKPQVRPMELWDSKQDVDDWNTWHAHARKQALGPVAAAHDTANRVGIYEDVTE